MNFPNGQQASSNQNGGGQRGAGRNDVPLALQLVGPPTTSATLRISTSSQAREEAQAFRLMQALQNRGNPIFITGTTASRQPQNGTLDPPNPTAADANNMLGDGRDAQINAAQAKLDEERRKVNDDIRQENHIYKRQLQEQQTKIAELEKENEMLKSSKQTTEDQLNKLKSKHHKHTQKATSDIDDLNSQLQQHEQKIGLLQAQLVDKKKEVAEQKAEAADLLKKNLQGDFDNQKLKEADAIHVSKVDEIQKELKTTSDIFHQREKELLQEVAGLKQNEKHLAQQLEAEKAERVRLQLKEEKWQATSNLAYDWMLAFQNEHHEELSKFSAQFTLEKLMTLKNIFVRNGAGTSSVAAPPRPVRNLDSVVSAAAASTSGSVTTTTGKKRKTDNTSEVEERGVPLVNDVDRPAQASTSRLGLGRDDEDTNDYSDITVSTGGGQESDSYEEGPSQIVLNEPDEQDEINMDGN